MNPQVKAAVRVLRDLKKQHATLYTALSRMRDKANVAGLTQSDRVDVAYVLKEAAKLLDDLRKEANHSRELIENVACAVFVQEHAASLDPPSNIKGQFVTGTPDVKEAASLPRKSVDPDRYYAMMKALGVEDSALEADVVRPHWPTIVDLLTKRAEAGLQPIAGIDPSSTYPVYSIRLLCRQDPLDLLEEEGGAAQT